MFEQSASDQSRSRYGDWMVRGVIALAFMLFGVDKFSRGWIALFQQIGIGQWFRYCTGVIEILGGILVLIRWTAGTGLALLASTMAAAAIVWVFVVHQPANSIFPGVLMIGLAAFWWNRRDT